MYTYVYIQDNKNYKMFIKYIDAWTLNEWLERMA